MPSKKRQGQSHITEAKQRGIGYACYVNGVVAAKKQDNHKDFQYIHVDLNAGCGYNKEVGCVGSPVAAYDAYLRAGLREEKFTLICIDNDADAIAKLNEMFRDKRNVLCHYGDNVEMMEILPRIIEKTGERPVYALGLILSDPNGTGTPVKGMSEFSRICPRMDFLINWNGTQYKRDFSNGLSDMTVEKALSMLGKDYWLIREPLGAWQFALLLGRNFKAHDYPANGFYHLDSPKGQTALQKILLPSAEFKRIQQAEGLAQFEQFDLFALNRAKRKR